MKKLALLLALFLLIACPAYAISLESLIESLKSENTILPDLTAAFGSQGEPQGEVFATGLITGEGILYDDAGSGSIAADLILLGEGFSASSHLIAGHDAILYTKGSVQALILAQIIPGKTLVIASQSTDSPEQKPEEIPTPAVVESDSVLVSIKDEVFSLSLASAQLSSVYIEAVFTDGVRQLVFGIPASVQAGDTISPEYVLSGVDCYPYVSYIDESGAEWYAVAWNEPIGIANDLSILYSVKMEPGDMADYAIALQSVKDGEYLGSLAATLINTGDAVTPLELAAEFVFSLATE